MCSAHTDPPTLRRGCRTRIPSARLRPLGDAQVSPAEHLGDPEGDRPGILTPIESTSSPPRAAPLPTHARNDELSDDLREVLSAGGEVPRSSETALVMEGPATHRCSSTQLPSRGSNKTTDTRLGQVRSSLRESSGTSAGGVVAKGYDSDENDLIRYTGEQGKNLPAIPKSMVADDLALVHTLHGHAGVGVWLLYGITFTGHSFLATPVVRAIVRMSQAQETT